MNTPPMPWRWAFAALVAGGLAACGTSSATSDAGAPLDAGPSDDATVGDSPNGFDANVARYDGPTPV